MSTIYVQKEGQKWGPFTTEELEGKVVDGVFSHEDLFWTEGMEEWHPLAEVLEAATEASEEEPAGEAGTASFFEVGETNILFDSPEARLTSKVLHLGSEDLPVTALAKATVQTETIKRTRPIAGCVFVGVAIACIAFLEIERPNMTAWILWGAVLAGLFIWWLRMLSMALRSAATLLIVDLRNGDERILRLEPAEARELATAIDQAVIDATGD